ncbi:MAG: hypothetical protein CL450_06480 [Acidimicrobiaceae bacterium]|nr:hypothetical protein [Acidimicrobiaceae bacterium]|tara:strand:- start:1890 stop:2288 length:399 start_codon:yes stop_codon:yes gene_type:complete
MNTGWVFGLVLVCVVLEILAEVVLNIWAKPTEASQNIPRGLFLVSGLVLYCLIGLVYGNALKHGEVTLANAMWQCLALLTVTAVGVSVFGDRPSTGQWAGIGIAALGFVVMLSGSKELGTGKWFRPPAFANE